MKKLLALAVSAAALGMASPAPVHAVCDSDEILVQVKPGYNPDQLTYRVHGPVSIAPDETNVFSVTDTRGSQQCMQFPDIPVGDSLTVDATFAPKKKDGGVPVSCSTSFQVVAPGSIACGPIEVYYQVFDGTCSIICN